MGNSRAIEVIQARIGKTVGEGENFLYPEINVRKILLKPGNTGARAETLEGVVALALAEAVRFDGRQGKTFIADFEYRPYRLNGPWDFSAATHKRIIHLLPTRQTGSFGMTRNLRQVNFWLKPDAWFLTEQSCRQFLIDK